MLSYSLPSLALNTAGNFIYWVYVPSLPVGPAWFLHGFATTATLSMLVWHLAYLCHPRLVQAGRAPASCRG